MEEMEGSSEEGNRGNRKLRVVGKELVSEGV